MILSNKNRIEAIRDRSDATGSHKKGRNVRLL